MAEQQHPYYFTLPPLLAGSIMLFALAANGAEPPGSETQQRWAVCPPPPAVYTTPPPALGGEAGQTVLTADEATAQTDGLSHFRGNVVIQHNSRTLQGDAASYDQRTQEVSIEGNVLYHSEGVVMQGAQARMRLQEQSGELQGVNFHFPQSHAFGRADTLSLSDADHSSIKGVSYTTCNPDQPDWVLSASELELDQLSNTGEAYHTVLRFKGVPLFYSPYLNFPLAGRKSGLLMPVFGTSDSNGTDIRIPIYWNIAPNYDATLTPRNLTARGPMMMSEFRFLGENSQGQLQADYLSEDKIYGDDRSYLAADHQASFADGWYSILRWRSVSDELYLHDLGENAGANAATHLERRLDLGYRSANWNFLARAQDYQTLTGSEPYQRLPQLILNGHTTARPNRLQWQLKSEVVTFSHDTKVPTGTRLDIKPTLSLPLQGAAWYLKPSAAWRYTDYQLTDYPQGERFTRSLPLFSLDSGLFFDRETTIGGRAVTHTLEPRLFYLSVPYEDQDLLPLFDSGDSTLSFSQMFRDNRFNGADRQGDAEQLTTALTSRLLDDGNGRELLRASIGRIHYFTDRQVRLQATDPVETYPYSDLFAELVLQPAERLRLSIDGRYNNQDEHSEQLNGRLRYQPDRKRLLGLDYRYDRGDQLRQSDTLLFWPLAAQWQLLARWRYDLDNEQNLDLLGGVEYDSCCWALRLIARNHRDSITNELQHNVYLTFSFKGLGSLGKPLEDALEEGLLTYE